MLTRLKADVSAWSRVDAILEGSKEVATKFFALSILEDTIKFRWRTLPAEQRNGIRAYVVHKIVAVR